MKKPEKLSKPRGKSKETVPHDEEPLDTQCGACMKHFPYATAARIHLDQEHPRDE